MTIWGQLRDAIGRHGAGALVTVVATRGSAPRDAGAAMVVTPEGYHGTIGGGALEWRAIAAAQAMLGKGRVSRRTSHALGPELGQCCGGHVELLTEVFDSGSLGEIQARMARDAAQRRRIYLFGAGHVGRALVLALAPLPFEVVWVDPRPSAFPAAMPANVTAVAPADVPGVLDEAPEGSLVFVMTHSHALDLAIVEAALRSPAVAHTGLIGSATKRARFTRRLGEAGIDASRIEALICPIGVSGIASKEPAMIALATAAQIAVLHESLASAAQQRPAAERTRA
ncbi:MAG: xanthine dehydrogenase accessory protein XdhC [Hyphomicrobiales bacterium]